MKVKSRTDYRQRRRLRVRQRIVGTPERPRMCVSVSNKHITVQFVDDREGRTLAAVSTMTKDSKTKNNRQGAAQLGVRAAEEAKKKGIEAVVFDRGGLQFHGRLKALADEARKAGLRF